MKIQRHPEILRVKFSDIREHRFRHNFYVTPMCMCSEEVVKTLKPPTLPALC